MAIIKFSLKVPALVDMSSIVSYSNVILKNNMQDLNKTQWDELPITPSTV